MAAFGNTNAAGNRNGETASRAKVKAVKDRLLDFTIYQWDKEDEAIRWKIWERLANNLLPRTIEGSEDGSNPLLIKIIRAGDENNQTPLVSGQGNICPPEV
jgi:hypothetical protein